VNVNSIVIVNLVSPVQRFLGRLLEIQTAGITVRGIDLDAFEDWINSITANEESGVQATTTFLPLHRIEKMILDEGIGAIPSLSNAFLARVGKSIGEYLE
jgi:hypothetical protein